MKLSTTAVVSALATLSSHHVTHGHMRSTSSTTQTLKMEDEDTYYVFLQKFPLEHTMDLLFHTEVLVCNRTEFADQDQQMLDDTVSNLQDYAPLEESWWDTLTADCVELGYGGAPCKEDCCGSPHGETQLHYPLNGRTAVISNADGTKKSLYIYGTGSFDGDSAYHALCDQDCWSDWSGVSYNPLTNNCNTFTSTVLSCVYGLSQKKPHLGPSDMVTVNCEGECPPSLSQIEEVYYS